jgi:DNA-binding MarR family transcriptional regulator
MSKMTVACLFARVLQRKYANITQQFYTQKDRRKRDVLAAIFLRIRFKNHLMNYEENKKLGYIALHRSVSGHAVVDQSLKHFRVWFELLILATHTERNVWFDGKKITLKKGQLITGRTDIALKTRLSPSTVERILKTFENEQQIEQQKTPRGRLITVVNYEPYQHGGQQVDNKWTTSGQQVDTNNNVIIKELKNVNNKYGDSKLKKNRVYKSKKYSDEQIESIARGFINAWNHIHGTKYRDTSWEPIAKNLAYWLDQHDPDDILQAMVNVKLDRWWKDKATPIKFLRTRNANGACDNINDLLNAHGRSENIPPEAKIVW